MRASDPKTEDGIIPHPCTLFYSADSFLQATGSLRVDREGTRLGAPNRKRPPDLGSRHPHLGRPCNWEGD